MRLSAYLFLLAGLIEVIGGNIPTGMMFTCLGLAVFTLARKREQ